MFIGFMKSCIIFDFNMQPLLTKAWFPSHGKRHNHDTKTKRLMAWFPLHGKRHDHDTKTKRLMAWFPLHGKRHDHDTKQSD